ncbi:rCG62950 [Rattus norvegicus]|uniref:RCG62950 n=1 Tax=Rattus norvegicus TaxID=10116 RepID=A6JPM5_RAT|nr:rCG62950 [Rattus norvegicus]
MALPQQRESTSHVDSAHNTTLNGCSVSLA